MKLLSLDLATRCSGFACFSNGGELIDYGEFNADVKEENIHSRMLQMKKQIVDKIKEHKISYIVAEEVPVNFNSNLKTGKDLSTLQGVVLSVCDDYNLGLQFLSPSSWRSIMGMYDGSVGCKKREYQKNKSVEKVNEIYGFNFVYYKNSTKTKKSNDDTSEAILLGLAFMKENNLLKENIFG